MENQFNEEPKTEGLNTNNFYAGPDVNGANGQVPPAFNAGEMPGQQYANPAPQAPYMPQQPVPPYGYQNGMPQYDMNQPPAPMYPPVQPGMPPMGAPVYTQPANTNNGLSVAGLVFGILGILFPYFVFPLMGIIFSVIGQKKSKENGVRSGVATGGLVCGIIGMVFTVLFIVLFAILAATGKIAASYYNGFISSLF